MTRVLLVEDDAWLADVTRGVLLGAGYEVDHALHAMAAIDTIDQWLPDVIVLDVLLSGSTGFALLNELQSHADTAGIPVILYTNLAEQFSHSQLTSYGVKRVVDKTTAAPHDIVVAVKAVTNSGGEHENVSH